MLVGRIHCIAATLAALVIAAAMIAVPGFCAAATAPSVDDADAPEHVEHHHDDHGDICGWLCSIGGEFDDEDESIVVSPAMVGSTDELDDLEVPDLWWSPDLVVELWLIDRLAEVTLPATASELSPPDLRPDRSGTYLTHSTLLI